MLVPCSKPNHVSTRRDLRTRRRAVRVQRPTRHRRVHRALRIHARLWRRLPSARPGYRPYTDPYCSTDATDALREFCSKRWCCYVDAENCDLDDVHSSLLQSDRCSAFLSRPLSYSYETCGASNLWDECGQTRTSIQLGPTAPRKNSEALDSTPYPRGRGHSRPKPTTLPRAAARTPSAPPRT